MSQARTVECSWLTIPAGTLAVGLLTTLLAVSGVGSAFAQSASASLAGSVVDATGAVLSGATITAIHDGTAERRLTVSSSDGSFVIPTLAPGRYVVSASRTGFIPTELRGIVLNVDDRLVLHLKLSLAGVDEAVTVVNEVPHLSTSPAVSTVIDRKFVESLPLNGRSFQALLELTPGIVLAHTNGREGGQFSVNGQRTSDNYFMIDGVSANIGTSTTTTGFIQGAAGSGQLPALTALGGTGGLVSVDALQEFRIHTSGYAPEFGRVPGGQVSLVTRSGTNVLHGSAFEYFRHNALDATDWFVKRAGQPEAELRQHNFGAVLGGPILRNRTFAFGSYERLQLLLPQARTAPVPTLDLRREAVSVVQPYLSAMPLPNGRDLGNGFAEFLAIYSDPAEFYSTSVRVDHHAGAALKFFGRLHHAPSFSETRVTPYGYARVAESNTSSGTVGSTWILSDRMVHDLRLNVAVADGPIHYRQEPIGGATMVSPVPTPSGRDPASIWLLFNLQGGSLVQWGPFVGFRNLQFNVVNSLTKTVRLHELKVGLDFRRTKNTAPGGGGRDLLIFDPAGLRSGRATRFLAEYRDAVDRTASFDNLSVYAQDHWRMTPRLTLSYGVRWEFVPAPRVTSGAEAVTLDRTADLSSGQVGIAAPGTALWTTRYNNFAPRIGGSYLVSAEDPSRALILKGGIGTFHGLGYGQAANAFGWGYPFLASRSLTGVSLPVNSALQVPPVFGVDPPSDLWVMDRQLQLPYTLQWNIHAEQAIGRYHSLSVGYVGASGRRLLKIDRYRLRLTDWPNAQIPVFVSKNLGHSDYHAWQVQFQRRLSRGMQAIVSYTLGRSRDTGSSDAALNVPSERLRTDLDYGYASFDVRHVLSGALTYQVPEPVGPRVWRAAARGWGVDIMMRAHSGYPVDVTVSVPFPPDTASVRPNVVPGESFWLDDPMAPGGRRLNRQAFSIPPAETQGNLSRGIIRGFSLSQVDLAVHRQFRLVGRLSLQLRVEAFNVFNTPNFAGPDGTLTSASFGLSGEMLGRALGGQNALYQVGGPRSLQVAIKFSF